MKDTQLIDWQNKIIAQGLENIYLFAGSVNSRWLQLRSVLKVWMDLDLVLGTQEVL